MLRVRAMNTPRVLACAALAFVACRSAETTEHPEGQAAVPAAMDALALEAAELRRVYAGPPSGWPAPNVDPDVAFVELGLVERPARPADPRDVARVELGQTLFFDARLSGTGQMACASCHDAELGWADGR